MLPSKTLSLNDLAKLRVSVDEARGHVPKSVTTRKMDQISTLNDLAKLRVSVDEARGHVPKSATTRKMDQISTKARLGRTSGQPGSSSFVRGTETAPRLTQKVLGPSLNAPGHIGLSANVKPDESEKKKKSGAARFQESDPIDGRDMPDDDEQVDEELEHTGAEAVIPRSSADSLVGLGYLGITVDGRFRRASGGKLGDRSVEADDANHALEEEHAAALFVPSIGSHVEASDLCGPHWRVEHVESRAALLRNDRQALHSIMQNSACILDVDPHQDSVFVLAQSAIALETAQALLKQSDLFCEPLSRVPEECHDEDGPDSVTIVWDRHIALFDLTHTTARPSFALSTSFRSYKPHLKALRFQFGLDDVQSRAIACIEYSESVLMCAPTSAGKTAVAEYAIAMALRGNSRVIYTSPIKALSNQKFLELSKRFGVTRIGLVTGDIAIATDAPVVVMTLEILQAMLFKQARDPQVLDDFKFVVLDEAHFIGNEERGVAWEEVLILLPAHITLVMLSATVPNDRAIAAWIAQVRVEPVHIVRCDHRPIPLTHEVFRCGPPEFERGKKRSFFKMYGRSGEFLARNLSTAVWQRNEILKRQGGGWRCPPELIGRLIGRRGENLRQLQEGLDATVRIEDEEIKVNAMNSSTREEMEERISVWLRDQGVSDSQARPPVYIDPTTTAAEDLERLLGLLWYRDQLPAIGFCFERKMCEQVALALACAKRMDLSTSWEKRRIGMKIDEGIRNLDMHDRRLEQVIHSRALLMRGIGVHHSGMLPILRELVEILFKAGLLKVVFATETFSIGLNMPARSVIFVDVVKFDGTTRRILNPGEFKQMSGRAGRRGIDSMGVVYMMLRNTAINGQPAQDVLTHLYVDQSPEVRSHYRMRWASLLHLICTGPAHVQFMLRRSFLASTTPTASVGLRSRIHAMGNVLQALDYVNCSGAALPKGSIARRLMVPEDALFVTEVVVALRGFVELTPPQTFAVCACFIAEGPPEESFYISDPHVRASIEVCQRVALKLSGALHREGLACSPKCDGEHCSGETFMRLRVRPKLAETAFRWASGEDFKTAVQYSGIAVGGEGLVVRGLRRLDELMREITFILRNDLGATQCATNIQETRQRIRRGVLAAQSMYLGEAEDHAGDEIEPDEPWPEPRIGVGQVGALDPLDTGFSHNTCHSKYRDGRTVSELVHSLVSGDIVPSDVEELEVYWFRHRYYTLGNRRLAAYRLWRLWKNQQAMVPVKAVSRQRALAWGWLEKFTTGFTGGRKVRIRGTQQYVGITREQSTFSLGYW